MTIVAVPIPAVTPEGNGAVHVAEVRVVVGTTPAGGALRPCLGHALWDPRHYDCGDVARVWVVRGVVLQIGLDADADIGSGDAD
jgi:hypothetical protein